MTTRILFAFFLALLTQQATSLDLKNITENVFGEEVNLLPVAFGDFNSDKLTDVFVVNQERNKISILLAREQTFSSVLSEQTYFLSPSKADKKKLKLECALNDVLIEAVTPGDFDGDGGMDAFVLVKSVEDETLRGFVMWGDHNQNLKTHSLVCMESALKQDWHHEIKMASHPLLIDANGDYVADLFGVPANTSESTRSIWIYPGSRTDPPEMKALKTRDAGDMRPIHSNSFVDLDKDGNADILVTSDHYLEVWHNSGSPDVDDTFVHSKNVKLPKDCSEGQACFVGQLAFADFDLDGNLDLVLPICHDGKACANSSLYFATVHDIWHSSDEAIFKLMTADLRNFRFSWLDDDPLFSALAPRVGDINLDGYPDLLLRMLNPVSLKIETHLLLNVPADGEDEIIVSKVARGFVLQDQVMQGLSNTIMATFFDLYENGMVDVILMEKDSADGKYRIGAFTNITQDSDAYFVKVIVLTGKSIPITALPFFTAFSSIAGKCFNDCLDNKVSVPYGTNSPGQTICYRTQRPGLEQGFGEIESCAAQLTQTAHSALQLPYTIFGLGLAPNFLDYMFVNVTNATASSRGHTWSQVLLIFSH